MAAVSSCRVAHGLCPEVRGLHPEIFSLGGGVQCRYRGCWQRHHHGLKCVIVIKAVFIKIIKPEPPGWLDNSLQPGCIPNGSLLSLVSLQELEQFLYAGNWEENWGEEHAPNQTERTLLIPGKQGNSRSEQSGECFV